MSAKFTYNLSNMCFSMKARTSLKEIHKQTYNIS